MTETPRTLIQAQPLRTSSQSTNGNDLNRSDGPERVDTIVIGGGQAGLAMGYHLAKQHFKFVILDANNHVGDSWRKRWDSLRLLAPARYSGLPGMPQPAPAYSFPTKDDVADYLQDYARKMNLPVRNGVTVRSLSRVDGHFVIETDQRRFEASQVVVATGAYHHPNVPSVAAELDPKIRQFHSSDYRNPSQFQQGAVLIVGASNSGAEIAHEAAKEHRTWLSGRDTGQLPFHTSGRVARLVIPLMWFTFNHVLTVKTPMGRKAQPYMRSRGAPLERVRREDLAAAGVERVVAKTVSARDGLPELDDGRVIDVANVVWCTGFRQDFDWIQLPVIGGDGWPLQRRGVVPDVPGLYFVGLPFLYSFASELLGGVGRDAEYIARHIAKHVKSGAVG
jgi:putative flavoprotein involved in K+ transport